MLGNCSQVVRTHPVCPDSRIETDWVEELSSSTAADASSKPVVAAPVKKKRKATRALKITNVHMKEQVSRESLLVMIGS